MLRRNTWMMTLVFIMLYLLLSREYSCNLSKLKTIPGTVIPARIHQTWKEDTLHAFFRLFNNKRYMKAWKDKNQDFEYYFWGDHDAAQFVKDYYPHYFNSYQKLPSPVLKADVFRYMVLNSLGGVYTDADTIPLKSVRDWIQPHWACPDINFIAGVEFDIPSEYDYGWRAFHPSPLQLCQWTMASKPNHEILDTLIDQIFTIIKNSTAEELAKMDVISFTGPIRWSRVIFSTWEAAGFSVNDFRNFGENPRCFSNKLILPITCFNPGITDAWDFGKMGSKSIYDSDALVRHLYAGSWRPKNWRPPSQKKF